jgi:hypothetical protein
VGVLLGVRVCWVCWVCRVSGWVGWWVGLRGCGVVGFVRMENCTAQLMLGLDFDSRVEGVQGCGFCRPWASQSG